MRYKPTEKFKQLTRANAHQGLSREEYNKFMDGKTVDCTPPKALVKNGFLEKAKKVEAKDGN